MPKYILALIYLFLSATSHAELITYNQYTLDTETNIINGNGLQWLQWDVTRGQSINMSLNEYADDGWRLASHTEMVDLLNNFFDFSFSYEQTSQHLILMNSREVFGPENEFLTLFGLTYSTTGMDPGVSPFTGSHAIYGNDSDGDGRYNSVTVQEEIPDDDPYSGHDPFSGIVGIDITLLGVDTGGLTENYREEWLGIALVRASAIPVPATGWLFISALLGLIGRKTLTSAK